MFNAKKHRIEGLDAMVKVYGNALELHHGSAGSCEDVRQERDELRAEVAALKRKLSAVGHAAFKVPEVGP